MSSTPKLRLRIPAPPARPGDKPDFSHLDLTPATRRPSTDASEAELRDLPFALIRVLDDAHRTANAWDPKLPADMLRRGLSAMALTRIYDERMFRLHRQGKASFFVKSAGEEAIGTAQSLLLDRKHMCFPSYRHVSWLLARDYPLADLVNQVFSNAADPLQGRQLPSLYSARDYGFYTLSGNVGSRIGHAVGWAMGSAFKGDDKIAVGHIGEGASAEGDFHEALTFASAYRAPVILCVTNNQYAISTFPGFAGGEATSFAAKAIGYGIPGLRVDGNDFLAVWAATDWAAQRALNNLGPTLIEFVTYRQAGHSTSDDPTRYRPGGEPEAWPLGDPIERLRRHLMALGEWNDDAHERMLGAHEDKVRAAIKAGEAIGVLGQSKPPAEAIFTDVFETPDWRHAAQHKDIGS